MALSCAPSILVADEPTTALDVTIQAQILDLVKSLRDQFHMAMIWITHDLGVVAGLADRVMVMYAGFVIEDGSVDEIYSDPRHPYTMALGRALPRVDERRMERLKSIRGAPPIYSSSREAVPSHRAASMSWKNASQKIPSW